MGLVYIHRARSHGDDFVLLFLFLDLFLHKPFFRKIINQYLIQIAQ